MPRALIVLAFVFVALAVPVDALACRCTEYGPRPAAVRRADLVIVGEVVETRSDGPRRVNKPSAVVIDVTRTLKGESPARITVELGLTSCAITDWRVGETWVVFAQRDGDGRLSTRQCTGSTKLADRGEAIPDWRLRQLERL